MSSFADRLTNRVALSLISERQKSKSFLSFLKNNIFVLLIILIIIAIIIWRFKHPDSENFMFDEEMRVSPLGDSYTTQLDPNYNNFYRPVFNPYYPTEMQNSYVRYLPNELLYADSYGNITDNSTKISKTGGIIPDQGINDMEYSPVNFVTNFYPHQQFSKGPEYANVNTSATVSDGSNNLFRQQNFNDYVNS